jgi:hypothetical protein
LVPSDDKIKANKDKMIILVPWNYGFESEKDKETIFTIELQEVNQ